MSGEGASMGGVVVPAEEPVIRRDERSAGFFDGAAREELMLLRCAGCGAAHPPTASACPHCGGTRLEWAPASGEATLASWAVPHDRKTGGPAIVLALVELAEGPWLHTRVDADPSVLRAGLPLAARFVHPDDGESFPVFVPAFPAARAADCEELT